jgi:ribosomal protein L7/L12
MFYCVICGNTEGFTSSADIAAIRITCSGCGAAYDLVNHQETLLRQITKNCQNRQKISAIKNIRNLTGLGLKMCKDLYCAMVEDVRELPF